MAIIEVNHVTKEYQLGQLQSLKDTLLSGLSRLQGKKRPEPEKFKALDDINFKIEAGEVVGIIGHNGAGKSTLLKILSQITTPTSGNISIKGKIAPLIEVGAGLIPDLTGRENIILNSTILGIPKKEIYAKMDGIIEFSELEEFIDTPVKRYSSGMKVKLGFSIATSLDAEILIVDEVLAVGDIAFQRKCLSRMEKLINEQGRTVLIVGHNIRQLERLCSRMILLNQGKVELDASPGEVSKLFLDKTTLSLKKNSTNETDGIFNPTVSNDEIEILGIKTVTDENNEGTPVYELFSDLKIEILLRITHPINNVEINVGLHNPEMIFMTKTSTALCDNTINLTAGIHTIEAKFTQIPLCPGTYGIGIGIYDWSRRPLWTGSGLRWLLIEAPSALAPNLPTGTLTYMPAQLSITPQTPLLEENALK